MQSFPVNGTDMAYLEVGEAEAGGPLILAILHDGDGDAGNVGGTHERCDGGFNLCALVGRKLRLLRGADSGSTDRKAENKEEQCSFALSHARISA